MSPWSSRLSIAAPVRSFPPIPIAFWNCPDTIISWLNAVCIPVSYAGPAWGGYYGPYRPYYYAPYYAPPVVYAAPPVAYAPQPAYYDQAPVQATPTSPVYRASDGQYCREYQSTIRVDGHYENSYGTACQQPDGSWHVSN